LSARKRPTGVRPGLTCYLAPNHPPLPGNPTPPGQMPSPPAPGEVPPGTRSHPSAQRWSGAWAPPAGEDCIRSPLCPFGFCPEATAPRAPRLPANITAAMGWSALQGELGGWGSGPCGPNRRLTNPTPARPPPGLRPPGRGGQPGSPRPFPGPRPVPPGPGGTSGQNSNVFFKSHYDKTFPRRGAGFPPPFCAPLETLCAPVLVGPVAPFFSAPGPPPPRFPTGRGPPPGLAPARDRPRPPSSSTPPTNQAPPALRRGRKPVTPRSFPALRPNQKTGFFFGHFSAGHGGFSPPPPPESPRKNWVPVPGAPGPGGAI